HSLQYAGYLPVARFRHAPPKTPRDSANRQPADPAIPLPTHCLLDIQRKVTVLPQIKSGHIGGAVRPESGDRECVQLSRWHVISARLCATTNGCACRCNSSCTRAAHDADGVLRTPRHDQCIPGGLNRSAVLHKRFAKVSEETSDGLESRWIEPDAGISR